MGDKPHYGEPIKMLPSSEAHVTSYAMTLKPKNLNLGCLLTARRSIEETLETCTSNHGTSYNFM
jgi:hypothetical protein